MHTTSQRGRGENGVTQGHLLQNKLSEDNSIVPFLLWHNSCLYHSTATIIECYPHHRMLYSQPPP